MLSDEETLKLQIKAKERQDHYRAESQLLNEARLNILTEALARVN